MYDLRDYDSLDLYLEDGKIRKVANIDSGAELKSFHKRVCQSGVPKIYILKEKEDFLYVGVTFQPLRNRLRSGLSPIGSKGYHGYHWKDREIVRLHAWCLPEMLDEQLKSLEAELVYLIRKKTGKWPLAQTEIHFNNKYQGSATNAEKLFGWIP